MTVSLSVQSGYLSINREAPNRGEYSSRIFFNRPSYDRDIPQNISLPLGTEIDFTDLDYTDTEINYFNDIRFSSPIIMTGTITEINRILKTVKYQSQQYFNGNDFILLKIASCPILSDKENENENNIIDNNIINESENNDLNKTENNDKYGNINSRNCITEVNLNPYIESIIRISIIPNNDPPQIIFIDTETGILFNEENRKLTDFIFTDFNLTENLNNTESVGVVSFYENTVYQIGKHFEISDPDINLQNIGKSTVFVMLSVDHGSVSLSETGNINFYENKTMGLKLGGKYDTTQQSFYNGRTGSVFFSGAFSDVQNTLKNVFYQPDENWFGHGVFSMYVNDLGKYARTVKIQQNYFFFLYFPLLFDIFSF